MILKINVLLNKFPGVLYSIGKIPELKSDQILHMDKSILTTIGKNQITVHLIDVGINQSLERIWENEFQSQFNCYIRWYEQKDIYQIAGLSASRHLFDLSRNCKLEMEKQNKTQDGGFIGKVIIKFA